MITVIIPTHNDIKLGFLKKNLDKLSKLKFVEIIIVHRMGQDQTLKLIKSYPELKLIQTEANSRAERLNIGIKMASGKLILLAHPRSLLLYEGLSYLNQNIDKISWGAFTHKFDKDNLLLKFTSWYSNFIRGDLKGIFYLDHCIFFNSSILTEAEKSSLIPKVDIFEDTYLSKILLKKSRPRRLPFTLVTSAIRFETNGIIFQSLMNQILKLCFYLRVSPEKMNKIYEKGLQLNSSYSKK